MKRKWDNKPTVGITQGDGDSMSSIGDKTGQSLSVPCVGHDVSRRFFTKGIGRIIGFGALIHFSLLKASGDGGPHECNGGSLEIDNCVPPEDPDVCLGGNEADDTCSPPQDPDECPGGGPAVDICDPVNTDNGTDECPGESAPADECPEPGVPEADACNTGASGADVCSPATAGSVDQCESGNDNDDECPSGGGDFYTDRCPGGGADLDICPPDGGNVMDECPGGGDDVDTCAPKGAGESKGAGDECSGSYSNPADDCRTGEDTDHCILDPSSAWGETDDVCSAGENTTLGEGPTDVCGPTFGVGPVGDDVCINGRSDQDACTSWDTLLGHFSSDDVCPGGGTDVDICVPDGPTASEDYCLDGLPETDQCVVSEYWFQNEDDCPDGSPAADECSKVMNEQDECPGGKPDVDDCPDGQSPEDVCTAAGGCAGGDQETSAQPVDTCVHPLIDGCMLISRDHPE